MSRRAHRSSEGGQRSENLVLCYHALSPTWEADLSTSPERFERQIRLLLERGYRPVRFTEAVHAPARSSIFAVTFDDAFQSVFRLALPILERLDAPATVFVPTDYIDGGGPLLWEGIDHWLAGPYERELAAMSWSEIRSLAGSGWEIGSHSGSHPHMTKVADVDLKDELLRSKVACEQQLATACTSFAYPYGDLDARVITAAAQAGYKTAAALPDAFRFRDPLQWPRIGVYRPDDERRFRLKVSPTLLRLRSSPAWGVLQWARIRAETRRARRTGVGAHEGSQRY